MRSPICMVFVALLFTGAAWAAPFPAVVSALAGAAENTAYTFTTGSSLSGKGMSEMVLKMPGPGIYLVTFDANYSATGSAASPTVFGCALNIPDVRTIVEATGFSEMSSSWYIGVSGTGIVNLTKEHLTVGVVCGSGDDLDWTYGDRPLEVTLVKLGGQVKGLLNGAQVVQHTSPASEQ